LNRRRNLTWIIVNTQGRSFGTLRFGTLAQDDIGYKRSGL